MWRYLTGCILIVIGAYFYMIFPGMGRKREIWKFRGTQWAHRGLHDKKIGIPENSMAAFREAIRANKGIELDVHLTKDKKIAVFHDDSLKRMCKVSGTIEEKTWEELKKLRLLETAEPIPLLEDVSASCAGESSDPDRGKAADRRYGNLPLSGKDDGRL